MFTSLGVAAGTLERGCSNHIRIRDNHPAHPAPHLNNGLLHQNQQAPKSRPRYRSC